MMIIIIQSKVAKRVQAVMKPMNWEVAIRLFYKGYFGVFSVFGFGSEVLDRICVGGCVWGLALDSDCFLALFAV